MIRGLVLLAVIIYSANAAETRLLDLDPTDAQQIISQQDQSLNYAPKVESDVPALRFLGEEPHQVLEDIYLAKQYHGQDGLGGYLYGYQVPDISKNEEKKSSGDLKGAYNYINGAGQEIKVEYWDNGNGFHQKDNIPQILPQQIDESPEVKAAKDAFLKRWQEEAERNTHPIQDPYNKEGQYASGPLSVEGQRQRAQTFAQPQYKALPSQNSYNTQQFQYQGAASAQQNAYARPPTASQDSADGAYTADDEGKYVPSPDEESTGPPKGFFYAFDYPVGIITKDQGRALPAQKSGDLQQVYDQNKQRFERQLKEGGGKSSNYHINN